MSTQNLSTQPMARRVVLLSSPGEPVLEKALRTALAAPLALAEVVPLPHDPCVSAALVQVLGRPRPVDLLLVAGSPERLGAEALAHCTRMGVRVLATESTASAWRGPAATVRLARRCWYPATPPAIRLPECAPAVAGGGGRRRAGPRRWLTALRQAVGIL